VRFIRVVGTHPQRLSPLFTLVCLEAMYSTEAPQFEIDPGTTLLIPRHNVATLPNNAVVVIGVSRSRNSLLNGDTTNYDWDSGYTCHELEAAPNNCIIVQLAQPYLLDSMRLLLWDRDDRLYSFYVEVSVDTQVWNRVVEAERRRSWQTLYFPRAPVVYVKIVGTANTANEVFHIVHFECPAMLGGAAAEVCTGGNTCSETVGTEKQGKQTPTPAPMAPSAPILPVQPSAEVEGTVDGTVAELGGVAERVEQEDECAPDVPEEGVPPEESAEQSPSPEVQASN